MKKIFIILFIFQLAYINAYAQQGGVRLIDFIKPYAGSNNPTHIDSLGKGGFMVVSSISDRNSINLERRKFGMLVFVQSNNILYQLKDSASSKLYTDSTDWLSIGLSSSVDVEKFLKYAKTSDSLYIKGNTIIGNTLILNSLSSSADSIQFNKNRFIDSANRVRLVVGGGVRIDSSVYVNKDLEVKGNLILNTGLKFNDSLIVSKGARIDSSLILKGKLYLSDSLLAKSNALIGSTLQIDSTSSSADSIQYYKNKFIDSANSVRLVVGGGARIDSSVYIRGNFRLGGDLILDSGLFRENFIVNLGEGVKFGRYNYKDTIYAKGKSIDKVFYDILTDITHPIYVAPTLKIVKLLDDAIAASSTNKFLRYEIGKNLGSLKFSSNFVQNNAGAILSYEYKRDTTVFSNLSEGTDIISNLTDTLYYTSSILYNSGAILTNRIGYLDSTGRINRGTIMSDSISIFPVSNNYWGYLHIADSLNITDSLLLGKDTTVNNKGFFEFASSPSKSSFSISIAGGEKYIYYAYPAKYPDLTSVMVGPFESIDAFTKIIRNVVNAQGYSQPYKIYISANNFSDKLEKIIIN